MNESDRAKEAFLRRVVERASIQVGGEGRFPCGHLRELRREHLLEGEHFPYGAHGAALLRCAVCPSEGVSS